MNRHGRRHPFALLQRRTANLQKLRVVQSGAEAVFLLLLLVTAYAGADLGLVEQIREVQAARFPVINCPACFQTVGVAHHLGQVAEAKLCHDFPDFLGDKPHEVDGVGRIAREVSAQLRVLRSDADRAGVKMADAHHNAAKRDQRSRGEAELFCAEQRGNDNVAAGLQLPVSFNRNARAQIVQHQCLMRFRQAKLPGQAGVLDGGLRGRPRAAVIAGNQHKIGLGFRNACRDSPDADFRYQLNADTRFRVGVFEVMDQLG